MQKFLTHHQNKFFYLASFLVPVFLFSLYFAIRGITPFGSMSILTVDLGQQYVDFFSFLKSNLFTNPSKLLFSFNKGLGGSFLGTFSYYLASPLNLIAVILPMKMLPFSIYLIIVIKIGLIGVASYFFFTHSFKLNNKVLPLALSTSFSLSNFIIAFHFSLMWLDSAFFLPVILYFLTKITTNPLTKKEKIRFFVTLALTLFTNFYTGYMVLLFSLIYLLYLRTFKKFGWRVVGQYLLNLVMAALINAWIFIPTFVELLEGKVKGADFVFDFKFLFPIQDIFGKFFTGSYSFSEMSFGMPNFYFGSIMLIFALTFFFNNQIKLRQKIAALGVIGFLLLSFAWDPLVLLWHLGQFPVWFPGRFSFVLSLFFLILVAQSLENNMLTQKFKLQHLVIIPILLVTYGLANLKNLPFLDQTKIWVTALFLVLGLLLLRLKDLEFQHFTWVMYLLVVVDLGTNIAFSLSDITYQNASDFTNYQTALTKTTKKIQDEDASWYRIEKTFLRDDDDSLANNFYGVGEFNSVIQTSQVNFLRNIGITTNDNSFQYNFGTVVTDSLLGIKYYLTTNSKYNNKTDLDFEGLSLAYRPDLVKYEEIGQNTDFKIYQNPLALPLTYLIDRTNLTNPSNKNTGRMNQENILQQITPNQASYFEQEYLPVDKITNMELIHPKRSMNYKIKDTNLSGKITFTFVPNTDDPYYLSIPSFLDEDLVSITVNHNLIKNDEMGNEPKLINVGSNLKGQKITISFQSYKNLDLRELYLYHFDFESFKSAITRLQNNAPKTTEISNLKYQTNTFTTEKTQTLMTQFPVAEYSGHFEVFDNGKKIKTTNFADTFLTIKLKPGTHHLVFKYVPTSLYLGLIISVVTLLLMLIYIIYQRKKDA